MTCELLDAAWKSITLSAIILSRSPLYRYLRDETVNGKSVFYLVRLSCFSEEERRSKDFPEHAQYRERNGAFVSK